MEIRFIAGMDADRTTELAERTAALEERMETRQAEYKTDIARLAADIARRDAEQVKRSVEQAASREVRLVITMVVVIGVATTILGTMIAVID